MSTVKAKPSIVTVRCGRVSFQLMDNVSADHQATVLRRIMGSRSTQGVKVMTAAFASHRRLFVDVDLRTSTDRVDALVASVGNLLDLEKIKYDPSETRRFVATTQLPRKKS